MLEVVLESGECAHEFPAFFNLLGVRLVACGAEDIVDDFCLGDGQHVEMLRGGGGGTRILGQRISADSLAKEVGSEVMYIAMQGITVSASTHHSGICAGS